MEKWKAEREARLARGEKEEEEEEKEEEEEEEDIILPFGEKHLKIVLLCLSIKLTNHYSGSWIFL